MKDKKYGKVRDHCHYTGEYRDAIHSICNLKCDIPKKFPIVSFYHKKISRRIQERIYLFRRKYWKIHKLYSSNRKGSYKNW